MEDGEPNGDMWVRAGQSRQSVADFCRRAWAHPDATIGALPLDAIGEVPWWPAGSRQLSLHRALVHVTTDVYRHAGHVDILRESIDGAVGADRRWSNLPSHDEGWWASYREKVEAAARQAR